MTETAIHVENLGKRYRIGELEPYKTLRDAISRAAISGFRRARSSLSGKGESNPDSTSNEDFWALRDVSLDIRAGEVLGIIGRNGAGKSTLLKILSRITEPTEGRIVVQGRVGALLDVGTGFHPELTGRENIYLNGAILGMTKREIGRKFDEIADFADIGRFLDTPVKHYSDGMRVRLGFAVAAHLEPEIMLVDEVLAVGDIAFQRKCIGKMGDVAKEGRTVLFVSHNMVSIQALTERAICLDRGRIVFSGPPDEAIQEYLRSLESRTPVGSADLSKRKARILRSVEVLRDGKPVSLIKMGTPLTFRMRLSTRKPLRDPSIGFHIDSERGLRVVSLNTRFDIAETPLMDGNWIVVCDAGVLPLNQGRYYVKAALSDGQEDIDQIEEACRFDVVTEDVFGTGRVPEKYQGVIYWSAKWKLESITSSEPPPQLDELAGSARET